MIIIIETSCWVSKIHKFVTVCSLAYIINPIVYWEVHVWNEHIRNRKRVTLLCTKLEILKIAVWKTMTNIICKMFHQWYVKTYIWLEVTPSERILCDHCLKIIPIKQVKSIHVCQKDRKRLSNVTETQIVYINSFSVDYVFESSPRDHLIPVHVFWQKIVQVLGKIDQDDQIFPSYITQQITEKVKSMITSPPS